MNLKLNPHVVAKMALTARCVWPRFNQRNASSIAVANSAEISNTHTRFGTGPAGCARILFMANGTCSTMDTAAAKNP